MLEPLEQELEMVASCLVPAGNCTRSSSRAVPFIMGLNVRRPHADDKVSQTQQSLRQGTGVSRGMADKCPMATESPQELSTDAR